jgi:hypothetical protein
MANNTGLIIGVSVVGVAAVGVTIYLLSRKPKTSKDTTSSTGYSPMGTGGFAPPNQRPQTPPIGYYANPAPPSQDSWWQQPLGQVGGNLANRLIDSLFKPKDSSKPNMGVTSTDDMGYDDYTSSNYRYDTDPNFYAGYGEA